VVEDQEPECECSQSDADPFDASGCQFHNPHWSLERAVAVSDGSAMYEQDTKEIA
jgi:hypothetical protein